MDLATLETTYLHLLPTCLWYLGTYIVGYYLGIGIGKGGRGESKRVYMIGYSKVEPW